MYMKDEQQWITEESQGVEFKGRCYFKEGRSTPHSQMRCKDGIISWRADSLKYRLHRIGECSKNPSVSVYQLVVLWEATFSFSEFYFFKDVMCLPIPWQAIDESTSPHCTECSAVSDPKWHDPGVPPPYSPDLSQNDFFVCLFPQWKALRRKHFADVEEMKHKTAETLKGIKIDKFKNVLSSGRKSQRTYCIKWRVLGKWLKFKHVRINTNFL